MFVKLRVADFVGGPESISSTSSANNESSGANRTDENQTEFSNVMRSPDVNQAKKSSELQQSENSEYDGVLYCKLDKGNGVSDNSRDAEVEKIMIDTSIPYAKTEE